MILKGSDKRILDGDWGGGFTHTADSPLKIVIDRNYIIQKVNTESFYNSDASKRVEKVAKIFVRRLEIGKKFVIKNDEFKKHVEGVLSVIPCKRHIGHDVFEFPHMLKHILEDKDCYHFRDSKAK